MAQTNKNTKSRTTARTHEGAQAMAEKPLAALGRVMNAHMLWEDGFYLDGVSNADALALAVDKAAHHDPLGTGLAIIRARQEHNIRHASLMAAVQYAKGGNPDARDLITNTITRADELAEVLAMAGGRRAPHSVMKGVRDAFAKFDEYQFGKYRGEGKALTLRDAVFLTHPSPAKIPLVQKIVDGSLETPNTWETRLSGGEDKKAVFEDLLASNKLGAMALLRNLRNMDAAGVSMKLITDAFEKANWSRVLPFRFLTAALTAPKYAVLLDKAFRVAVAGSDPLPGRTAVLLDTSHSMTSKVSRKSIVACYQAGAALAAAVNGDVDLYEWADRTQPVPNWNSLSTALSIKTGTVGWRTNSVQAVEYAQKHGDYDRIIMISDMQFSGSYGYSRLPRAKLKAGQKGYTINLQPYDNPGLLHGDWTHLTGFSAATLKYIAATDRQP